MSVGNLMEEEYYYEEFMTIAEFPGYMVSDYGRVWNTKTNRYLKGSKMEKVIYKLILMVKRVKKSID